MSWQSIASFVAPVLPVLGTALGGPLGGAAGAAISKVLGVPNEPDQVMEALKADPDAILKLKTAELENESSIIKAYQAAEVEKLRIVNETIQAEVKSDHWFVRSWRPFYGYCVALSWLLQMSAISYGFVYIAITHPEILTNTVAQFAALSASLLTLWSVALAVLGVSVHKRSKDKDVNNTGLLENAKRKLDSFTKDK